MSDRGRLDPNRGGARGGGLDDLGVFCDVLEDSERTPCEIWSRVMGYHRPVESWNPGKQSEHKERKMFTLTGEFKKPKKIEFVDWTE